LRGLDCALAGSAAGSLPVILMGIAIACGSVAWFIPFTMLHMLGRCEQYLARLCHAQAERSRSDRESEWEPPIGAETGSEFRTAREARARHEAKVKAGDEWAETEAARLLTKARAVHAEGEAVDALNLVRAVAGEFPTTEAGRTAQEYLDRLDGE
jgi:hypothetical protein